MLLASCIVILGVSPFPASIDTAASLAGLAVPQASRCGCQFSMHQNLLFVGLVSFSRSNQCFPEGMSEEVLRLSFLSLKMSDPCIHQLLSLTQVW
jgi:hypothetical protein